MSIEVERATTPCEVCGAQVSELRRGRCWGCYTKWTEARPVGRGATCVVCSERRREMLRMVELRSRSLALCHSCAARTVKLLPIPYSVEGLRAALRRDRRGVNRRDAGDDRRVFPRERRSSDRRRGNRELGRADTDPAVMIAAHVQSALVDLAPIDVDLSDETRVREAPRAPRAPKASTSRTSSTSSTSPASRRR